MVVFLQTSGVSELRKEAGIHCLSGFWESMLETKVLWVMLPMYPREKKTLFKMWMKLFYIYSNENKLFMFTLEVCSDRVLWTGCYCKKRQYHIALLHLDHICIITSSAQLKQWCRPTQLKPHFHTVPSPTDHGWENHHCCSVFVVKVRETLENQMLSRLGSWHPPEAYTAGWTSPPPFGTSLSGDPSTFSCWVGLSLKTC